MIQINNINDKAFEIIGFGKTEVKSKVYTCEVQGTKLMLRNANDRDDILVEFLDYTLYTVNSATFASIDLLQAALVDVVFKAASGGSGAVWGEITGTLSTQTDVQNALNDKSDTLVSGTNIKTINGGTILGSGDVATASANPSNTFLPINTNGSFTDSPFYTLPPPPLFDGFGGIGTKSTFYAVAPEGGVPNYADFGLEIQSYKDFSNQSSVSLGDYAQSIFAGEFYWYTGSSLTYDGSGSPPIVLPFGVSGIAFNTSGYNLFESTLNYFKLDAKTGNPNRVDGLLFNTNAGGLGFGKGIDINSGSTEESIYWNLNTGDFTINGVYGMECFYNSPNEGKTYLSQSSYDLGIWSGAMYISDNLTLNAQPTVSTKILKVRDSNGNSYHIKLYNEV